MKLISYSVSLVLLIFILYLSYSFSEIIYNSFFLPKKFIIPIQMIDHNSDVNQKNNILASTESKINLEFVIKRALINSTGQYGIVIKNLKTGESYSNDADKQFATASLYKLWLMATTLKLIKENKLKEEEVLKSNSDQLIEKFHLSTDSASIQEGNIEMTVKEALERSITISDNTAALLLTSYVKVSNIANLLTTYNFSNSKVGGLPQTTPNDIANFFEKLYKGEIIDKQYSARMIDILKKQRLNDRIPKYLPDGIEIAHKTGELDEYKHDAGIVYTDKSDYIIVILSKSDNPVAAAERIALISKNVFEYFQK